MFLFFFFFQAEDGIRDLTVTGVQTCALPISRLLSRSSCPACAGHDDRDNKRALSRGAVASESSGTFRRSEERRVGKECRSRGSPHQYKKKKMNMIGQANL